MRQLFNQIDCLTILPGDKDYDSRRQIFNGIIDRHPAVIVLPRTIQALKEVFLISKGTGLRISVRGGGHNVAGLSLVDGGVVIDNAFLKQVVVDPIAQSADVGPGTLWGDLDQAAQPYGLVCPGGIISDTGVAGLTLGGGIGWLNGVYGLSCDALIQADVLLASGAIVSASVDENPELFWGIRGGGGNFGIVTRFRFKLARLSDVYCGSIVYAFHDSTEALDKFWTLGKRAPDALTLSLVATVRRGRKTVSIDMCYAGEVQEGKALTDQLLPSIPSLLVADTRSQRPYVSWQKAFDDETRRGRRSYWRSLYVDDLTPAFISTFNKIVATAPSPFTMLTFDHIHGVAARVAEDATAYSQRNRMFLLLINTNWDSPIDDRLNLDWADDAFHELSQFGSSAGYINYLSNEGQKRVVDSYGGKNYERLRQLKLSLDPANVFSSTQNIRP